MPLGVGPMAVDPRVLSHRLPFTAEGIAAALLSPCPGPSVDGRGSAVRNAPGGTPAVPLPLADQATPVSLRIVDSGMAPASIGILRLTAIASR